MNTGTARFYPGMVWISLPPEGQRQKRVAHVADEAVLEERIADSGVLKVDTAVADSYKLSDAEITFTRGTSGQTADQEQLKAAVLTAVDQGI